MTISELICRLQQIKCEYGDLPLLIDADCNKEAPVIEVQEYFGRNLLYIYISAKD